MTNIITQDQLAAILPNNREIPEWYTAVIKILPKYEIITKNRIAGFLAQCGHESLDFTILSENLNYSAQSLNRVFPKYFKNAGRDANAYARQPERIANIVYASRMDNGDTGSGDGWKFRGRGIIQLTGFNNYSTFGKTVDMTPDEVVNYVQTKQGALESACWFWKSRNINSAADANDIITMTKLINGGTHGLDDRRTRYNRALTVLSNIQTKPTQVFENLFTLIRLGSTGLAVSKVQEYLNIPVTGIFDAEMNEAVKRWQKFNGLTPDGIVGPATYRKMFG